MSERLDDWMEGYIEAWESNEARDIAALFHPEAIYDPQTADGELHGHHEIVEWWKDVDDTPGNWEFEWIPLVETDDLAVITATTRYLEPPASYRNLFVVKFDEEGRCFDFTEWYVEEERGPE
jgi:hypothetical protein